MRLQTSLVQFSIYFVLFTWVECLPRERPIKKASETDLNGPSSSRTATTRTMGQIEESNCRGNKISWDKVNSPDPWARLSLAEHLTLYQNIWAADKTEAGSRNDITCHSFTDGTLEWEINFQMISSEANRNQVKSYPHANLEVTPMKVKDIQQFQSSWNWKISNPSQELCADVSYDIFLTRDPSCRNQQCSAMELMVWLAAINGARPSGSQVGTIVLGRKFEFQIWKGVANGLPVISLFPADPERRYTSFSAKLKPLLLHLAQFGVDQDLYVRSVGAGVEPFRGRGILKSKYDITLY